MNISFLRFSVPNYCIIYDFCQTCIPSFINNKSSRVYCSCNNGSETVHHRLILLRPDLAVLHNDATNLVLKAKAESDTKPLGAAMALNRLLDQFKGALIDKCRGGKGTNYDRIADCLAANSSLTMAAVEDGQAKYDILSEETMRIRKNMQTSSGTRVVEILHEIEDHIIIITDALDPMKLGISFTSTFIP